MCRSNLIALFLIAATLSAFWPVCIYDFVQFDDDINVYGNRYLNPVSFQSLLHFWGEPHERLYIPLTYSVWAIAAACSQYFTAGELDPAIFHTVNLTLHLLSVLVVFAILRILMRYRCRGRAGNKDIEDPPGQDWAAGLGALLFAVHPLQVQAIAWVTGMKVLLCGFLSLVAVWQYIIYATTQSAAAEEAGRAQGEPAARGGARRHYAAALVAFVLALLSKPAAAAVPLAAWALDYCVLGRPARKTAAGLTGWFAVAVPILLLSKMEQPAASVLFVPPLWARLLVAGDAVAFYLYKLVLPIRLGFDYGRTPAFVLHHGWIYASALVPCVLAALLLFSKNRRLWLASLAIFIAGILPASGLIPGIFQNLSTVQDHYIYFSMLGPALALAYLLSRCRGRFIPFSFALLLCSLGMRSAAQVWTWENSTVLFEHTLEVNPNSWFARTSMGIVLKNQGKLDEAIAQYHEAIRLKPGFALAHYNLGNALTLQGKYDEAIIHYSEALKITPEFANARKSLLYALEKAGRSDEAEKMRAAP